MTGSGTNRTLRDPLAEALFPVLIHRLNNATQILSTLSAVLGADLDEALLEGSSEDLAAASRDVHQLGWLLGVLASAGGADLLLERRERSGLSIVLRVVREALRRSGRDLAEREAASTLPELAADVGDGWQVPWAIGSMLFHAGESLAPGTLLTWSLVRRADRWCLACRPPGSTEAPTAELATRIEAVLPGAALTRTADGFELSLPGAALLAPA